MDDPASVENGSTPSKQSARTTSPPDPTEPSYVAAFFGPEVEYHPLPPGVADLVGEVSGLAAVPPVMVAAVALATLVAAVGPKIKLQRGRSRHSLGFSVIVSHQAPRTLPWFDALTAPFTGLVFERQLALLKSGPQRIREDIAQQREEFERACKTTEPNSDLVGRLRADLERAPTRLKPNVAGSTVLPKDLARILPDSFDGGLTLAALENDPGTDLLRLKKPERAHLAELLNRSWTGAPLTFGRAMQDGALSLLWQTRQSLNDLLGAHGFDPAFLAVPALVFRDEGVGKRVLAFQCEPGWKQLCTEIFNIRSLNRETDLTLNADAESALAEFTGQMAGKLPSVPAELRPHVDWLPELTARLAGLFWSLAGHKETVVAKPAVLEAIKATRWLGRHHLMAAAVAVPAADTTDRADKKPVLLAKIRTKGPITRRELRRCFDNQRVGWFDETLDALIEGGKARYNESGSLIACQ